MTTLQLKMFKTRLQTVEVSMPNVPFLLYSLEEVPVCPEYYGTAAVTVRKGDGTRIEWNMKGKGEVISHTPEGVVKTWWPAPTLQEVIQQQVAHDIRYIQYHSDGSVSCRGYGGRYWWGPEKAGVPEQGTVIMCDCEDCNGFWRDSDTVSISSEEDYYDRIERICREEGYPYRRD